MEKQGYRANLEVLLSRFPGRVSITPAEAATAMNANIKTIYAALSRVSNPLPSKSLGTKKTVIPIADLARWMS